MPAVNAAVDGHKPVKMQSDGKITDSSLFINVVYCVSVNKFSPGF